MIQEFQNDLEETKVNEIAWKMYNLDGFTKETVSATLKSKDEINEIISWKYLSLIGFQNLGLVEAYRKLASVLYISGDSQDVDLIHERFCKIYYENNSDGFNEDECYTLVTAFMMLNSDLHSKKISKKMTLEQFVFNINSSFPLFKFDMNYLKSIYKSIKKEEITHEQTRVRKRSNEIEIVKNMENKKTKNEKFQNEINFGFKIAKMRPVRNTPFQLFDKMSWKMYFISIDNLRLSLYKYSEFKEFLEDYPSCSSTVINMDLACREFIQCHKPTEILSLNHAVAISLSSNNNCKGKCELTLINDSKYLFKLKDGMDAELWAFTMNRAASLLSKPPYWNYHGQSSNTRTIIRHKWAAECSQLNFEEQYKQTENKMLAFKQDMEWLENNPSKKSEKTDLKYLEKSYQRYSVYLRTLQMINMESVSDGGENSSSYYLEREERTRNSHRILGRSASCSDIYLTRRIPLTEIPYISSNGDNKNDNEKCLTDDI